MILRNINNHGIAKASFVPKVKVLKNNNLLFFCNVSFSHYWESEF